MQSMGLGSAANREGAFGDFQGTGGPDGLQSIGALDEPRSREVAVPVGETIELNVPAVCLNLRLADPHAARYVQADGRRGIQPRTLASARRYAAWPPTAPAWESPRR